MIKIIFNVLFLILVMSGPVFAEDPAKILSEMSGSYSRVDDYTATFYKQERVKGTLLPEEKILLKFKKPFKVYMKWLPPGPNTGLEVLYVQGENGGKVIGHSGGFFGFFGGSYDPNGRLAMRKNRHPVTDLGLGKLIEKIDKDIQRGKERRELKLSILGEDEVCGRKTWHILKETPAGGYYAPTAEIWVDKELNFPIKIKIFGPGCELLESYWYENLRINPGLKDEEFTKGYKDYRL